MVALSSILRSLDPSQTSKAYECEGLILSIPAINPPPLCEGQDKRNSYTRFAVSLPTENKRVVR